MTVEPHTTRANRSPDVPRLLYVAGWGRSGSTLLDRVLGQVPGFVSLGEVRELWQRGLRENRPCGCGEPFLDCEFWGQVGTRAFGGWGELDLDEALRLRNSIDRGWTAPILARGRGWPAFEARVDRYLALLRPLYRAIQDVSGASVIIDSSKLPMHALLLLRLPLDMRIVHLTRDSRGVAFSWRKQVRNRITAGDPKYLERYDPVSASARYLVYNHLTDEVQRRVPSTFLRYEDFVARPLEAVCRLAELAGVELGTEDLSFIGRGEVDLAPNHTVDGNPMRFSVGRVELRVDEEWRTRMPGVERAVVTWLTYPLLRRYGYSVRGAQ